MLDICLRYVWDKFEIFWIYIWGMPNIWPLAGLAICKNPSLWLSDLVTERQSDWVKSLGLEMHAHIKRFRIKKGCTLTPLASTVHWAGLVNYWLHAHVLSPTLIEGPMWWFPLLSHCSYPESKFSAYEPLWRDCLDSWHLCLPDGQL